MVPKFGSPVLKRFNNVIVCAIYLFQEWGDVERVLRFALMRELIIIWHLYKDVAYLRIVHWVVFTFAFVNVPTRYKWPVECWVWIWLTCVEVQFSIYGPMIMMFKHQHVCVFRSPWIRLKYICGFNLTYIIPFFFNVVSCGTPGVHCIHVYNKFDE